MLCKLEKAKTRWKTCYIFCMRSLITKLIIIQSYDSVGPALNCNIFDDVYSGLSVVMRCFVLQDNIFIRLNN